MGSEGGEGGLWSGESGEVEVGRKRRGGLMRVVYVRGFHGGFMFEVVRT